jgi:hypothetical protein
MEKQKKVKNKELNFIIKSKKKYGAQFNYSNVNYVNSNSLVKLTCNIHNITFEQSPTEHLRGYKKCVLCGGPVKKIKDFLIKSNEKHGDYYDYSKVKYVNSQTKVKIICPEHGEFEQLPNGHFKSGCQKCFLGKHNKNETIEAFLFKANKKHKGYYSYDEVKYVDSQTKVTITCPKHGKFNQLPYNHIRGKGCKSCSINKTKNKLSLDENDFIVRSNKKHHNKYSYLNVDYVNSHSKVKIICPEHGEFEQLPYDHLSGHGCNKCTYIVSSFENEINDFITNELHLKTITSSRKILNGKEIDIYIPSLRIAIEFNGLYWHSELFLSEHYHNDKTNDCNNKGIQLIHIFEDEWLSKKNITKSRLKNILGLTKNKMYARKCFIKEIPFSESKKFLNKNHLQGSVNASINLGLYNNDELVSLMNFNKPRSGVGGKYDGYELSRFCNKLDVSVIGGASKLLKHFIKEYEPNEIRSYADRRWSQGNMYEMLKFTKTHINRPNYWYIINKERFHRFNFRKSKLKEMGYNIEGKTEREVMLENKIYRIYDCGTITYSYKPKNPS